MAIGLVGRKCGMTRIFTDAGESVPVTVVEALPNRVTQVKSVETDGYRAVQVSFGKRRPQLLTKAAAGHFAKAKVEPGRGLIEFRLGSNDHADLKPRHAHGKGIAGFLQQDHPHRVPFQRDADQQADRRTDQPHQDRLGQHRTKHLAARRPYRSQQTQFAPPLND